MAKFYRVLVGIGIIASLCLTSCTSTQGWVLTQYGDYSGSQGMFYTLKNQETGALIIVDGGNAGNEQYARHVIQANGGHVTAWFLTHYHGDHVSVFNAVYKKPDGIKIDKVYATPLEWESFEAVYQYWDTPETFREFLDITAEAENVEFLQSGDSFEIDDLHIDILSACDARLKEFYSNEVPDLPNNCSLVFKISGQEDSILFCGDAHQDSLADQLIERYGDTLRTEYVQTGHHGNNSFPEYFYDIVAPKEAFFDAPEWLMTGEKYTAEELKAYFEERGTRVYDYRTAPNWVKFR